MIIALLFAARVGFSSVAVLEQSSPGLVPSMHSDDLNEYAPDLTFIRNVTSFPLLRAPRAITFSPAGELVVADVCDPSPCVQITHDGTPFGRPIHDTVAALEFIANGDLIVLQSATLTRLDANGAIVDTTPLPPAILVFGFDVAADQCTVVLAMQDRIGFINICKPATARMSPAAGNAIDVRFLPDGGVLISGGRMAIGPDATWFVATSGNSLSRFDLRTRDVIDGPAPLRSAAYGAISLALRGEWRAATHPPPGRRSLRR